MFENDFQAWKSADLTIQQKEGTYWELALGPNIDRNELEMAIIRNQGQILANLRSGTDMHSADAYRIKFKKRYSPKSDSSDSIVEVLLVLYLQTDGTNAEKLSKVRPYLCCSWWFLVSNFLFQGGAGGWFF